MVITVWEDFSVFVVVWCVCVREEGRVTWTIVDQQMVNHVCPSVWATESVCLDSFSTVWETCWQVNPLEEEDKVSTDSSTSVTNRYYLH